MAFVVAAKWVARAGEEERVLAAVREMIEPSRHERGCLFYQPSQDPVDGRVFFFYEEYLDAAAYEAHSKSEHFQRHAVAEAIPLLESRERAFYQTVDA